MRREERVEERRRGRGVLTGYDCREQKREREERVLLMTRLKTMYYTVFYSEERLLAAALSNRFLLLLLSPLRLCRRIKRSHIFNFG